MLKVKEFKGSIEEPSIEAKVEDFLSEISADDIVDVHYATNIAQFKKKDGTMGVTIISSAIFLYEGE